MISARMNASDLQKVLKNTTKYSHGFIDGIELEREPFMAELGKFAAESFNKYVDSQARANPETLHHVYEWDRTGSSKARLFKIKSIPRKTIIRFTGDFLPSKSTSKKARRVSRTEPFVNKAEIMENGISIEVSPKNVDLLKFYHDGLEETVFTVNSIIVEHPGGDGVAGAFGETVDRFFSEYFTNKLLQPFFKELAVANEFTRFFPQGARGGGYSVGVKGGKLYLSSAGMKLI